MLLSVGLIRHMWLAPSAIWCERTVALASGGAIAGELSFASARVSVELARSFESASDADSVEVSDVPTAPRSLVPLASPDAMESRNAKSLSHPLLTKTSEMSVAKVAGVIAYLDITARHTRRV
jgi:hypothetical protein